MISMLPKSLAGNNIELKKSREEFLSTENTKNIRKEHLISKIENFRKQKELA